MSKSSVDLLDGTNESVLLNLHQTFEILLTNNVSLLSGLLDLVSLILAICFTMIKNKAFMLYLKVNTSEETFSHDAILPFISVIF